MDDRFESIYIWSEELALKNEGRWIPQEVIIENGNQTIFDLIITQLQNEIKKSRYNEENPELGKTIRTGEYRIGLTKAIDIVSNAKENHKKEHMETWNSAIEQTENRAWNIIRAYDYFDEYYQKKFEK
jgi:hypothetical protein